jgi:TctA family transporter
MSNGDWLIFGQRPIALTLLLMCLLLLLMAAWSAVRRRKDWRSKLAAAETGDVN